LRSYELGNVLYREAGGAQGEATLQRASLGEENCRQHERWEVPHFAGTHMVPGRWILLVIYRDLVNALCREARYRGGESTL
jgi:hypothetical protein